VGPRTLESFGRVGLGRDLFFAHVVTPAGVRDVALPPAHFVTLLVWNADGASTEAVTLVVKELFARGASYLCAWGSDCERVHDFAEEEDAYPSELASPEDAVRLTTWHADEELGEAIDFFLQCTEPDAFYAPSTKASLLLCIGPEDVAAKARQVLRDQLTD
jgi:hypothetical protein